MKWAGSRRATAMLMLLLTTSALADNVFLPLNGGEPVETGPVAAAASMRNTENDLFLLYLQDGVLVVRKSSDNGASFTPVLPLFGSRSLTNFRQLTLLTRVWEPPAAFFVADEDGIARLYGLHFSPEGRLSLLADGRLDDSSSGEIVGYTVMPESQDRLFIAYLKSGTLKHTCVSTNAAIAAISHADISNPAEEVTSYGIFECFPPDGVSFTGYYLTSENGTDATLHSFTVVDDRLVERQILDTAHVSGSQQVHFTVTLDDRLEVIWVNGREISTYSCIDGDWRRGGRVTAPLESFSCFAVTDGRRYFPALATWPRGGIYHDLNDPQVFQKPVNQYPILRAPGGIPSYKGHLFSLAYLEEEMGQQKVEHKIYDFVSDSWQEFSFPAATGVEILDAWIGGTTSGHFVAVLYKQADSRHLGVFQVNPDTLSFEQAVDVPLSEAPGSPPTADTVAGELLREDGLLVLTVGTSQVVVDVPARQAESAADFASYSAVTSHLADEGPGMFLMRTDRGSFLVTRETGAP